MRLFKVLRAAWLNWTRHGHSLHSLDAVPFYVERGGRGGGLAGWFSDERSK